MTALMTPAILVVLNKQGSRGSLSGLGLTGTFTVGTISLR